MEFLKIALIIISVITIGLILLQSNKEDAGLGALTGQTDSNLFAEKKEQGLDLYLMRATTVCVALIFIITMLINIYK